MSNRILYPPFIPVFGVGVPGAGVPQSALYYDTSTNPFTSYVYKPGTGWKAFGATGGGSDATALQGVGIDPVAPADGDALVYNGTSGLWEPNATVSGSLALISDTITAGAAASVTIAAIPNTFKDLILAISGASAGGVTSDPINAQFNGDVGANYDWMRVQMTGTNNTTSNTSGVAATQAEIAQLTGTTGTANFGQCHEILIPNYASTVFYKMFKSHGGGAISASSGNILSQLHGGLWASTVAINQIKLFPTTGPFANGSRISLYGRR